MPIVADLVARSVEHRASAQQTCSLLCTFTGHDSCLCLMQVTAEQILSFRIMNKERSAVLIQAILTKGNGKEKIYDSTK